MHHQYPYNQEDQHYKHKDASSPPCISYPEVKKQNIFHIKAEMIIQKALCVRFSKATKHLKSGFYLAYDLQYYLSTRCKNYSDYKKKKKETEDDQVLQRGFIANRRRKNKTTMFSSSQN